MYQRRNMQQDTTFCVMTLLAKNPDLTQRELAKKVGVSLGSINYCLGALIDKGLVKMQRFSESKNKFCYIYVLTPSGVTEKSKLTSKFLQRKLKEYELIKSQIKSI